jgi:hypothetical protein
MRNDYAAANTCCESRARADLMSKPPCSARLKQQILKNVHSIREVIALVECKSPDVVPEPTMSGATRPAVEAKKIACAEGLSPPSFRLGPTQSVNPSTYLRSSSEARPYPSSTMSLGLALRTRGAVAAVHRPGSIDRCEGSALS